MSATDDDSPPATIQVRSGESPDGAAVDQPTISASGKVIANAPPGMPPPRYELGEEIARGGMGRVVEATDTLLGRVVALKEALALDADSLRRFQRETKITARLEHPSIVPVHDAGTMADSFGAPFYVMRKIGGRPLEKLVATAETLNERLALIPHVIATAHAVAHAHERGVIHRDIKPSNILCGDHGETILIDWGLAKVKGEPEDPIDPAWVIEHDDELKTRAGIVYGTPGFMAPEQLRGNVVSERSDVYALGATLYHLLSRKPPHHAKTADEMMRAAVRAPPTPIDRLVQGVPRELITIVDKALAGDAEVRYQDARSFAEDLQRFLTGQLVASHHYTPREKIARFVRKNRVPVMVAAGAALALLVVGVIAVTRIVGERDRADAEARRAEQQRDAAEVARRDAEERTEKLTLQQARSKVASNPTEAIAMIKPLATKQWREVRSIATAARVAGIAWSMPAPRRAESVEMSRDGNRVLVAGTDGSVQIYDLVARTTKILVESGPRVAARFADSERKIVVWAGAKLGVLDARTGARISDVILPSMIADLEVVGVVVYYSDAQKKLWQYDLAARAPLEIATEEGIEQVAPSPDGRWIALAGVDHLYMYDRTQPADPVREVLFGKVRDLDWSDDGSHIAVLFELGEQTERAVADLSLAANWQTVHRFRVGQRRYVAWSADRMFTIGPTGVGVVSRNETTPRKQMIGEPVGVRESADRVVVSASQGGLAILTDDGDHVVPLPQGRLEIIDASARSPYAVGFIEGRMLVWNLAEMLPRRLAVRGATLEAFTGNDRVLAAYLDTTAEWIDLATRKPRPLGNWPASIRSIDGARDGKAACVIDATHHARLVSDDGAPVELGPADFCLFAGASPILATSAGAIDTFDRSIYKRRSLVPAKSKLVHVTVSRGTTPWVAAVFADGTLWRHDLATGTTNTIKLATLPPMILQQPDGVVVFPEGRMLRTWRTGDELHPLVELPKPVTALGVAGPNVALAFVDNSSTGYIVRLDLPSSRSDPFELSGVTQAQQSPDTGILVFANRGTIEVFDPFAVHRWTLAASPGLTFTTPKISNDALHILARRQVTDREKRDVEGREVTALLEWTFVLPIGPDATAKWLDQLTNAVLDPKTNNLVWR